MRMCATNERLQSKKGDNGSICTDKTFFSLLCKSYFKTALSLDSKTISYNIELSVKRLNNPDRQ